MHPAPSMVVFTVLSGLGLGLIALAGLDFGPEAGPFRWWVSVLAFVLTGAGGLASVGHLARPDRAWRAFSQWRSSWLSREACLMVATLAVFGLYAAFWCFGGLRFWLIGWIAAALAVATVYATAMIYHQIRAVPRWSVPPTPALFLTLSLTGGLIALRSAEALAGQGGEGVLPALALVISAGVLVWWQTAAAGARRSATGSDLGTATGLGRMGRLRLFEPPHTGSNYLLDEMAYRVARRRAFELRRLGAVLGVLAPLALVVLSWLAGGWLMVPALLLHIAGMLAFRWLFFAEAEHVQALYYGQR